MALIEETMKVAMENLSRDGSLVATFLFVVGDGVMPIPFIEKASMKGNCKAAGLMAYTMNAKSLLVVTEGTSVVATQEQLKALGGLKRAKDFPLDMQISVIAVTEVVFPKVLFGEPVYGMMIQRFKKIDGKIVFDELVSEKEAKLYGAAVEDIMIGWNRGCSTNARID